MLTLSDSSGRSSSITEFGNFQPFNAGRRYRKKQRTVCGPGKRSFDGIPVHDEDEFVQPVMGAPDVLNLVTKCEKMVVQYEGDSDNYDGKIVQFRSEREQGAGRALTH